MGSIVLLLFTLLIAVYSSAFLSSIIVLKGGFKQASKFLATHFNNFWKWGILLLIGLSSFGFYWSELLQNEGTVKSFLLFCLGAAFHLACLFLVVYLFIFFPLRVFKINKSSSSKRFINRLNLVLFPVATVYLGGLIFIAVQLGFTINSLSEPVSAQSLIRYGP